MRLILVHLLTMGTADYVKPEMAGHFRHNAMFIGTNVRQAVNDGRADYTPIYLSEIESLFESGQMPIDVALIQVSPPDSHGFCSFGVGVDTTLNAAKNARYVIAQVNDQMPRTYGDSFIHVGNLDAIVEASRPLCELPREEITDLHRAFARHVPPPPALPSPSSTSCSAPARKINEHLISVCSRQRSSWRPSSRRWPV